MCGIVGYTGKQKAYSILIKGLRALEYRGYDSAGIALKKKDTINIFKEKGRVKNLEEINDLKNDLSTIGIAHTRWATHGVPSKENAHPHTDKDKIFTVVHNGIIENYLEIKEFLSKQGYTFASETDTEVIPNLIHYYYKQENDVLKAIYKATKDFKGSYAILVLSIFTDGIYVAKNGSPLVIGEGKNENFIASDIPAILAHTRDFYFLNDLDFAYVSDKEIIFYDENLNVKTLEKKVIDWEADAADKKGYPDYMLKEIFEQPQSILDTLAGRLNTNGEINFLDLKMDANILKKINKIYLVACGTAMHAGKVGKMAIEELTGIISIVEVASEFRYNNPIIDENTLCLFISQSGETADTIAALKLAKSKGARTIAISNVVGSSITREADDVIYTHAGPEIAVASTKAYVSQVSVLILLAIHIAEILNTTTKEKLDELKSQLLAIPDAMTTVLNSDSIFKDIAHEMKDSNSSFYIGRGYDYNTALEGSLKLKEISYIHSEAYPAGELKHGPIALIEDGTWVLGIITNKEIAEKTLSNLEEVITRGASVILITNCNIKSDNMKTILIPKNSPLLAPMIAIIPLQLIAYYIAKERNLDVDKPRNLAKSVTVE